MLKIHLTTAFLERICQYGFKSIIHSIMKNHFSLSTNLADMFYHIFYSILPCSSIICSHFIEKTKYKSRYILFLQFIYFAGLFLSMIFLQMNNLCFFLCSLLVISIGCGGTVVSMSSFGREQTASKKYFYTYSYFINFGSMTGVYIAVVSNEKFSSFFSLLILNVIFSICIVIFFLGTRRLNFRESNKFDNTECDSSFKSEIEPVKSIDNFIDEKMEISNEEKSHSNQFEVHDLHQTKLDAVIEKKINIEELTSKKYINEKEYSNNIAQTDVKNQLNQNNKLNALNDDDSQIINQSKIFIFLSFLPFIPYFSLRDQCMSTWSAQAQTLKLPALSGLKTAHFPALYPLFVCLILPSMKKLTRLQITFKLLIGYLFLLFAYFICFLIEYFKTAETTIFVQAIPYFFLSLSEVFTYINGQEYAYSIGHPNAKYFAVSVFRFMSFFGNIAISIMRYSTKNSTLGNDFLRWFFIGFLGFTILFIHIIYAQKKIK